MGCLHLMGLFSCQEDKDGSTVDIYNREAQPILKSVGVSTLISDSGVIRYKIISEDWFIYDRTVPQYYSFEKGLFLEKFDEQYHVDAFINCDTAYYYNETRVWELRGRVCVKNLKGETFKTSLLFWDMNQHQIYSPAYMVVDGIEQDLEGYDFRSDESMTDYLIHSSSGAFPMGEDREVPRPDEQELIMFGSDTTQDNTAP